MACGIEIKSGSKVVVEIKNDVACKGGIGEDGIRVHEGAELEVVGSGNLYCSGNNEHERVKLFSYQLGLFYGDVGFDPANPQATKESALSAEALEEYNKYTNPESSTKTSTAGSGIGHAGHKVGAITINGDVDETGAPKLHITALGYGHNAFGIGGGDEVTHTINNAVIEKARGGYSEVTCVNDEGTALVPVAKSDMQICETKVFNVSTYDEDPVEVKRYINKLLHPASKNPAVGLAYQQGKNEAEGGCAIGVGCGVDKLTDYGKIVMNNVIIKEATGGSKATAIGGMYWCEVDIEMDNCDISNVTGGNAAAGIGGSRYNEMPESHTRIKINNSKIKDIKGGQFAAAIGSGYNCYTSQMDDAANCVIKITGNSKLSNIRGGMAAPAIGAGYHQGRLEGFIDGSVELDKDTVKAGDNWADMDFYALSSEEQSRYLSGKPNGYSFGYYADNKYGTLSKAQDIGYGTLYTHGLNFGSTTVDGVKQHKLNGRECINSAYLKSIGYKVDGLTDTEKTELNNALKADPAVAFGGFDRSVTFTVAGETIPNPRLRENNLSRNTGDCPADWLVTPLAFVSVPERVQFRFKAADGKYHGTFNATYTAPSDEVEAWFSFPEDAGDVQLTKEQLSDGVVKYDIAIDIDYVQTEGVCELRCGEERVRAFFTCSSGDLV